MGDFSNYIFNSKFGGKITTKQCDIFICNKANKQTKNKHFYGQLHLGKMNNHKRTAKIDGI